MKWLFVCVFILAGCIPSDTDHDGVVRIACLGDSNTAVPLAYVWGDYNMRWCEYTAAQCGHIGGKSTAFYNLGIGGAVAHPGHEYVEYEESQALMIHADTVIARFVTNDVNLLGDNPTTVADSLEALCDWAFTDHGIGCMVMNGPPNMPIDYDTALYDRAVSRYNATIANAMIIDGRTDMVLGDGTHYDDASQRTLATRVAAKIGCQP